MKYYMVHRNLYLRAGSSLDCPSQVRLSGVPSPTMGYDMVCGSGEVLLHCLVYGSNRTVLHTTHTTSPACES